MLRVLLRGHNLVAMALVLLAHLVLVLLIDLCKQVVGGHAWLLTLLGLECVWQRGGKLTFEGVLKHVFALSILIVALHHDVGYLHIPVDDVVDVEVFVVVAKRVDKSCSDMEPSTVEDELENGEEWDDKILDVVVVANKVCRPWCLERHLRVCSIALQNELSWMEVLEIQTSS